MTMTTTALEARPTTPTIIQRQVYPPPGTVLEGELVRTELVQPQTGRRRCGIREHRRSIRSLQKQVAYYQSQMYQSWAQRKNDQERIQELATQITNKESGQFLRGLVTGLIIAVIAGALTFLL